MGKVLVLKGGKSSGDWLYNSVNISKTTEQLNLV